MLCNNIKIKPHTGSIVAQDKKGSRWPVGYSAEHRKIGKESNQRVSRCNLQRENLQQHSNITGKSHTQNPADHRRM